ncbi:MAG TPA: hypothetical protein VG273_24095 [Bryobacteraceae bacterium]|jgi:hypothetical protein|nr:hypothetical protein [Bryobacteraceae bacterium]
MKKQPSPAVPPSHLTARSQALWLAIAPTQARSPGRRVLFEQALESLDRADAARTVIASEGMFSSTRTTGVAHAHPALRVEKECMAQFIKIWALLSLRWNHEIDGR